MNGEYQLLNPEEREQIAQRLASGLDAEPSVVFAYLYGSFVEPRPFRDIDVGVYLDGVPVDRAAGVALMLSESLSARLGMPVDVRALNAAPVSFVYHVLRGRLLVCRDEAILGAIIEQTASRYLDIAPLLRQSAKEAFTS